MWRNNGEQAENRTHFHTPKKVAMLDTNPSPSPFFFYQNVSPSYRSVFVRREVHVRRDTHRKAGFGGHKTYDYCDMSQETLK